MCYLKINHAKIIKCIARPKAVVLDLRHNPESCEVSISVNLGYNPKICVSKKSDCQIALKIKS